MVKTNENILTDIFDMTKKAWRHRPRIEIFGQTIWQDQTIPAAVLDTMDALRMETKDGLKPVLVKHCPTEYGAKLIFNLPPGISRREIESKLQYFEEQAGGQMFLQSKGKTLTMEVYTTELPRTVNFEFTDNNYYLPVPIGMALTGNLHIVDLAKIPHLLVAGQTGGGKSSFLHVLIIYMLLAESNRDIWPVIIDLKRLEFAYLNKHCLVIDDEENTCKLLRLLNRKLDKRLIELRDAGCRNITECKKDMPFIVLIIDELAELTDKDAQNDLNRLARLARAAGIHIVAATQRPDATLFKDFAKTRALLPGRLCFTVADDTNSRIVLGNDAAHKIPKDIPGRAVWKWEKETIVQGMYLGIKEAQKILESIPCKGGMVFEQSTTRLLPR